MKPDSKLATKLNGTDFIITAECRPRAGTRAAALAGCAALKDQLSAVNVSDNHYGVALSSLAGSLALSRAGIEPIFQLSTRDRNRIALQSDLLGAAFLGLHNVLCMSGYHQTLIGAGQAANVYDIDSIQLLATLKKMNEEGLLMDGTKIDGGFSMLPGAVANPYLQPLELNLIRLAKKVAAGARFIQTQAVFDVAGFKTWLQAADEVGLTANTAIIAGILPLTSADEARKLLETHTDFVIPQSLIDRLAAAGNPEAQKKEGLAICADLVKRLKVLTGVRGIHFLTGGKEDLLPGLLADVNN